MARPKKTSNIRELVPSVAGSMRVFIGWSGERSKALATALNEFLPVVMQNVQSWMSEKDIGAGQMGTNEILRELTEANFGIICLTPEKPPGHWMLFEAGALSKTVTTGRVVPYLLGLDWKEVVDPLAQFQHKDANREGTRLLLRAINDCCTPGLRPEVLDKAFEGAWPDLEKSIVAITSAPKPAEATRTDAELLEEILMGVRRMNATLSANPMILSGPVLPAKGDPEPLMVKGKITGNRVLVFGQDILSIDLRGELGKYRCSISGKLRLPSDSTILDDFIKEERQPSFVTRKNHYISYTYIGFSMLSDLDFEILGFSFLGDHDFEALMRERL